MPRLIATPGRLDLHLYEGDDVLIRFTVQTPDPAIPSATPEKGPWVLLDITGYTSWRSEIRTSRDGATPVVLTVDESQKVLSIITVSATGEQVRSVSDGARWDLQATDPSGMIVTFVGGEVVSDWDAVR